MRLWSSETLNALRDGKQAPGKYWPQLRFEGQAVIGSVEKPLPLNLAFAEGMEPRLYRPFWRQPRSWTLFEFDASTTAFPKHRPS